MFSISLSGAFQSLHQFSDDCNGGGLRGPTAGLLEASDGNLYGSTLGQGYLGYGTIFSLGLDGTHFKDVIEFNFSEGASPGSQGPALTQGSDGNLYGTTEAGGTEQGGTVFKLDLGLTPPLPSVKLIQPSSGAPGTTIRLISRPL